MRNKILAARMEPEIVDAIEKKAKEEDRPVAYIVRKAILQYLSSENIKIERPEKEIYKIPDELIHS